MLMLLTLMYALRRAFAVPIPDPIIDDRSLSPCTDLGNCRTIWNIIWSCLVTIFACTWVAIHPNVPKPGQNLRKRWLRRASIMFSGVIGPEFVIYWAWRQRVVACIKPRNATTLPGTSLEGSEKICRCLPVSRRLVACSRISGSHGRFRRRHRDAFP
jgi:hypothetical protein